MCLLLITVVIGCPLRWDITRSTFAGIDVLAVGARVLAQMRDEHVLRVLSQVVHDLVLGELITLTYTGLG